MAAKKKKANDLPRRREAAKKYFERATHVGTWLLGFIEEGYDSANDGSCHIATENPTEAKHAKALTLKQFVEAHRVNLINYLNTAAGKRELERALTASYNDLQEEPWGDDDDEEDDESFRD